MKTIFYQFALLVSLSPCLLFPLSLGAQYIEVRYPGEGFPAFMNYYDGNEMKQLMIPDVIQNPVVTLPGINAGYTVDLSFYYDKNHLPSPTGRNDAMVYYEPGLVVEGDLPSDCEYSKDGSLFAYTYQNSNNVIFYDAATYEILGTVDVVRQPIDIKMGENHAYVCCHEGKGVVVISLEDFSISNYISLSGTPCQIELSPGEDTAYIACDSYMDGWLVAVDLNNNQVIYENHDPYFHHFGWASAPGRVTYGFTKFVLSPDGSQFIAGLREENNVKTVAFNAANCHPQKIFGFGSLKGAGYSPSGDTLYIYSNNDDTVHMKRYNSSDFSIIDSIRITATCTYGIIDYSELVFNNDGTKVMTKDGHDGRCCIFNFNTKSCQIIPVWMLSGSPLLPSHDREYAVAACKDEIKLIHFESGQVYSSASPGVKTYIPLCVSTSENKMVCGNLPFYQSYGFSNEMLYAIDFNDIDNIAPDAEFVCGELPEADVSIDACFTDDDTKILSANMLNQKLSIIDYDDHSLDSIFTVEHISGVKVIPGTDQAILFGEFASLTRIISLGTCEIIKEVMAGEISEVFITSDGKTGYLVYSGGNNSRLYKLNLDGANTTITGQMNFSGCFTSYHHTNQETFVNTTTGLSPDGQYFLASYYDSEMGPTLNIIDPINLQLFITLPVPEECIYSYAFTDDSKRAIALGLSRQVPIIYLDGANSSIDNLFDINGTQSFSGSYNPVDGMFYVLEKINYIDKVDPLTGEIVETLNTFADNAYRIEIDKRGIPMVLTTTSMIYNGETYTMPGVSTMLSYDEKQDLFISAVPGPDVICIFDPLQVGIQQIRPGKTSDISIYPNPVTELVVITAQEEILGVKISDMKGKEVFSGDFNARNIKLSAAGMKPGMYIVDVATRSGNYAGKMVIR